MSTSLLLITIVGLPLCFSADLQYEKCSSPLRCGSGPAVFPNITYPFWGTDIDKPSYCGQSPFRLSCEDNQTLTVEVANRTLRVVSVKLRNNTITVADESLFVGDCPKIFDFNGSHPFTLNYNTEKIYLLHCSGSEPSTSLSNINCSESDGDMTTYHVFPPNVSDHGCRPAGEVPVLISAKSALHESKITLGDALEQGFELTYNTQDKFCGACSNSGGICGSELRSENFRCLCADMPHKSSCNDDQGTLVTEIRKVWGSVVGVVLFVIILSLFLHFLRKRQVRLRQQNLKALIPLKYYTYAQVKKITKSFAEVVGRGGFGIVYRGTLSDGRMVAVKLLKDSKGNGEDFLNEVASMSQTSHLNIVSLLGFCSEGLKRAIIYEFLGNGSLDKFISGKTSMNLDWTALYQIALGVARGLEYLHHGCKTRIVHFDIKPQNVLLDDNFCPKVSDFGLAKLCEKKECSLSLLDTRGTVGYIAPEMFSRVYGSVSHKSDVYSYGMLVLEMIGARNKERAHQDSDSNASSIYFP